MMSIKRSVLYFVISLVLCACKHNGSEKGKGDGMINNTSRDETTWNRKDLIREQPSNIKTPEGMVWIPGGTFMQGAVAWDKMAMNHEKPAHRVTLDGFFIDITEVTNADFAKFVDATGYLTVAEREIDWEEMKKQLPPGTPKPPDSILQPGSLTFKKTEESPPNLYDYSQWWDWTIGANWRHPEGPGSSVGNRGSYPVVHIAYEDALAYCDWAGRRLPTEAEWEYAARAEQQDAIFTWGTDFGKLSDMANSWEGEFPTSNTLKDGFGNRAPVKSYPSNPYGLYDMAGNVWEYTSDWYNVNYYRGVDKMGIRNPSGASEWFNPNAMAPEKVIKGGSYLCNASYCASFRISARMANGMDSSQEHLGFRTVATPAMLKMQ